MVLQLNNGDKITQNRWVHPAESTGVFIEKADGACLDYPKSQSGRQSYTEQISIVSRLAKGEVKETPAGLSLDTQIWLLDVIETIKKRDADSKAQDERNNHF